MMRMKKMEIRKRDLKMALGKVRRRLRKGPCCLSPIRVMVLFFVEFYFPNFVVSILCK